jgi:transposase
MRKLSQATHSGVITRLRIGQPSRAIAEELEISKTSVLRIRNEAGIRTQVVKQGRPRIFTERDRRHLIRLIVSGKADTATDLQKHIEAHMNIIASPDTIRRALKTEGMVSAVKRKKPLLSHRHFKARLDFAKKYKYWTIEDWHRVVFSDETKINRLGSDGRKWVWKQKGAALTSRLVQGTVKFGGGSIMLWGCMTAFGVGHSCRIDGGMDAKLYTEILEGEMLGSLELHNLCHQDIVFQQDNDSKHTSKLAKTWFLEHGVEVLDWPAQSPDLNPIEHLWDYAKRRLANHENTPLSLHELWERVQVVWDAIPREVCEGLIDSMPRRIIAVLRNKGGYTKY